MTPSPRPRPPSLPPVQYKGSDLDAARGPGLGCFWFQIAVLAVLIVVTPIGVNLGWPDWLNALLLFATIGLLLVSGQTIIFLLRIVAAERREGRRRPMAAARTATVGELEEDAAAIPAQAAEIEDHAAAIPAQAAAIEDAALPDPADDPASGGPDSGRGAAAPLGLPGDEPVRE